MPMPPPPVLMRLRALGLTQTVLAEYLGATQSAVSLWLTGKRTFEDPWRADANALLAVVSEHLAQGKSLDTVQFLPTHYMNRGGTTRTGESAPLTEQDAHDLRKLQRELAAQGPDRLAWGMHLWEVCRTAPRLAERLQPISPTDNLAAEELDALRRLALSLVLDIDGLLQGKALAALKEARDADQTA